MTILNRQLSTLTYDLSRLNALRQSLLVALDEYHNIAFTYGGAQKNVREARRDMRTDKLYEVVMQKLNVLDRLIEVVEVRRRARRDRLLAAGTAIVTAMLGLPVASQVTEAISKWDTGAPSASGGWITSVLNTVITTAQSRPSLVTAAIYGTLLAFVLIPIALSFWPSRDRRPIISVDESQPAFTKGFTWHEGFVWHDASSSSEHTNTNDIPSNRSED